MLVIGLMSGTSADGVDSALVEITEREINPLASLTVPYPPYLREKIIQVSSGKKIAAGELADLNVLVGRIFGESAIKVCKKARIPIAKVDLIGSHGQTIAHFPEKRATLQIGEPALIASMTGCPVVADFRQADLAEGGEGAPLTPMADFILFRHKKLNRLIVNIGGITNITFIPAGAKTPDEVIGFDTGFGNMTIDALVQWLTKGKDKYDKNGQLASKGQVNEEWLKTILAHPFFRKKPPKSAGREQFGRSYLLALMKKFDVRSENEIRNLCATLTASVAQSIAMQVRKFILPNHRVDEVLLCGGGHKNRALRKFIESYFRELVNREIKICTTASGGIDPDAREAIAFAILAYLTWKGRSGNIPQVTGASRAVVLGKIIVGIGSC